MKNSIQLTIKLTEGIERKTLKSVDTDFTMGIYKLDTHGESFAVGNADIKDLLVSFTSLADTVAEIMARDLDVPKEVVKHSLAMTLAARTQHELKQFRNRKGPEDELEMILRNLLKR